MAIENSIAGPIIPNYALIDKHNLHIIGEHYLRIHQNLMALRTNNRRYCGSASDGTVAMYGLLKKYPK
jgi:prephenate dehydratase